MSCGNPHEVPWSEVLDGVSPCLDGGPGRTGDERIRPQETTRSSGQPAEGHGSPAA
jgi:hypothetical protein